MGGTGVEPMMSPEKTKETNHTNPPMTAHPGSVVSCQFRQSRLAASAAKPSKPIAGSWTTFCETSVALCTPVTIIVPSSWQSVIHSHVEFVDAAVIAEIETAYGLEPIRTYSFPYPRSAGRILRHNETVAISRER